MGIVGVVIPTRNRFSDLKKLLKSISNQDSTIFKIIIVDSSDIPRSRDEFPDTQNLEYIHTNIRSAAEQRNMGKRLIEDEVDYIAFLDDDVLIPNYYLTKLIQSLEDYDAIGVSGIAVNPKNNKLRGKPSGLVGYFHVLFGLDSSRDGIVLNSGVNIPVRDLTKEIVTVKWLIGCSIWRASAIRNLEFERDFTGQSLAEDVIFSVRASKLGKLITIPGVVIDHFESEIGRPDSIEYFRMWVDNRRRLVEVMGLGLRGRFSFVIANFGQAIILLYLGIRGQQNSFKATKVIIFRTLGIHS